ncbi:50S ribosomal protein L9 [Candidatus Omnitrophota bacterium]
MKLILNEDMGKLGKAGDVISVKDGYGRNFLLPRGKAVQATGANLKRLEKLKEKRRLEEEKEKLEAAALSEKLQKASLTVNMQAGEEEKLFGSVTTEMISELLKQEGFDIDKKAITLEEPIKKLGVYQVSVDVHPEVKASVKLWVIKK